MIEIECREYEVKISFNSRYLRVPSNAKLFKKSPDCITN